MYFHLFFFGKPIAAILDRFLLSELKDLHINSVELYLHEKENLSFDYREPFFLGNEKMISTHRLASIDNIDVDSTGLVTIKVGNEPFILGKAQHWDEFNGWYDFSQDPHDKISLSYRHGLFSWFGIYNGAYSWDPQFRRNTYYVFKWTKSNGRELSITGSGDPQIQATGSRYDGLNFDNVRSFELSNGEKRIY